MSQRQHCAAVNMGRLRRDVRSHVVPWRAQNRSEIAAEHRSEHRTV